MPNYDYICDNCHAHFEVFQSMTASMLEMCSACEQPKLRRLIGAGSGLVFKGSGFYQTDYKQSKSSKNEANKA